MRKVETESFLKQAVSSAELSKYCFTPAEAVDISTMMTKNEARNTGGMSPLYTKILMQTTSRVGRMSQRFEDDPKTGICYRLTTGTVPVMNDGRILFVSGNGKPEWILPKGGWENDESEQQSALREAHEEAGITGELGAKLRLVEYETRKAKEARKRQEVLNSETPNGTNKPADEMIRSPQKGENSDDLRSRSPSTSPERVTTYTHVRMTLYVLYVTEVRSEWPESDTRVRNILDIDTAIEMLHNRPEFQIVLKDLKERNLHRSHFRNMDSRRQMTTRTGNPTSI